MLIGAEGKGSIEAGERGLTGQMIGLERGWETGLTGLWRGLIGVI